MVNTNDLAWLEGYTVIGEIQKPHGVRGEIKVRSETDQPERFKKVEQLFLADPKAKTICEVKLESFRQSGETLFLRIDKFKTPEEVANYRFCWFCIPDSDRLPLEEGEFYLSDLQGLDVYNQKDQKIGVVLDTLDYPANYVFEIKTKNKVILAPWVEDCVIDINLDENKLIIDTDFLGEVYDL